MNSLSKDGFDASDLSTLRLSNGAVRLLSSDPGDNDSIISSFNPCNIYCALMEMGHF